MSVTEAAPRRLAKATRRREPECSPTSLQKISQTDLVTNVKGHWEWLQQPRKERVGPPCFGTSLDLSACDFHDPALRQEGSLTVCLREADLRGSVFGKADLQDVDLRDADLTCAVLADAQNLLAPQLSGADLCHASLPDAIKSFEGLAKVDDLSKTASGLFLSMLLSCVYVWLVNGATFDSQLLTNSTTSKLPIIQTDISIVTFYWDAPGVLLGIYLYFHIYMQRLWEAIAKLPAVFPGGETVDVKTYPWMLNDLVCRDFVQLKGRQPSLAPLQTLLSVSLAWWAVPVTLLMIWGRYLRRHDGIGTALQLLALVVAAWVGTEFYLLAKATLRREGPLPARTAKDKRGKDRGGARWRYVFLALYCVLGGALGFLSYGAMWGNQHRSTNQVALSPEQIAYITAEHPKMCWLREDAGKLADEANFFGSHIGFRTSCDFGDGELSKKPALWDRTDKAANLAQGLVWGKRNLRYVNAQKAFWAKTILSDTHMEGADLQQADLRYAWIENSYLQGADLQGSKLGYMTMTNVNLRGAKLAGADMTDFKLYETDSRSLEGATFDHKTIPKGIWPVLRRYGARDISDSGNIPASRRQGLHGPKFVRVQAH